jgi:hypothetical protein
MMGPDIRAVWVTEFTHSRPKTSSEITHPITSTGDVCSLFESYTLLNDLRRVDHSRRGRRLMHVLIRIQGHLDPSWQEWLEGLEIVHEEGGTSQLSGVLADQAALYGVLTKIDHLSLTLLSLERCETSPKEKRT